MSSQPAASAVQLPGSGGHWTPTANGRPARRGYGRLRRRSPCGETADPVYWRERSDVPDHHGNANATWRSSGCRLPRLLAIRGRIDGPGGPRRRRARRRHAVSGSDGRTPGCPSEPASGRGLGRSPPFAAACGVGLWYLDRRSDRPSRRHSRSGNSSTSSRTRFRRPSPTGGPNSASRSDP